jgi:hypothetical protein
MIVSSVLVLGTSPYEHNLLPQEHNLLNKANPLHNCSRVAATYVLEGLRGDCRIVSERSEWLRYRFSYNVFPLEGRD